MPATVYYYASLKPVKTGCAFWIQWVSVTLVGFLVSLLFVEIGVRPYVGGEQGAIAGGIIGLAQWLVLRQRVPQAGWWILASIVSWGLIGGSSLGALGWIAPRSEQILLRVIPGILDGAMVGAAIGLGQWFVLKNYVSRAGWWTFVSTVSWAIALPLGWIGGGVLRQTTRIFLGEVGGLALAWVIVAGITGVALIRLLQRTPPP